MSQSLRVVVADDEPDMRDYFRKGLLRLGHQVVAAAADGRELVEQCRALRPDLVITDIKMPELDGIDAATQIYRERPVPVITGVTTALNPNGTLTLSLAGVGFVNGSTAYWNGAARPTQFSSATQLAMTITAADFPSSGVITVVNPAPGGGTSNEWLYVVYRSHLAQILR